MNSNSSKGFARSWLWLAVTGLGLFLVFFTQTASAIPGRMYFNVQGDTTATAMVQGDTVSWGVTCAVGDSMQWTIWHDVDADGVVDEPGDFRIISYIGTDGDVTSQQGLPDNNNVPDGRYEIPTMTLGLAAGQYIFVVEYLTSHATLQKTLTCTALPSPPNSFSGTVTIPGHAAPDALLQNLWIEADPEGDGSQIWSAFTDNNGAFTINIGSQGTDMVFRIQAPDLSGLVTPDRVSDTASGAKSGLLFAYSAAADSLYGVIKDLDDSLVELPISVYCSKQDNSANKNVNITDGNYVIPFSNSDLGEWSAGVSTEGLIPSYLAPGNFTFDNSSVHGIHHDFVCPKADTVLYIKVRENGAHPTHQYRIQTRYDALGYSTETISDTGTLSIAPAHISKHYLSGWSLQVVNWDSTYAIPAGYVLESTPSNLHPGDTATLNFVSGKVVRDTIKYDAVDGSVSWDSILVNLWSAQKSYNGSIDNNGVYTIYCDTGTYQLNISAPGFLVNPSSPLTVRVTGDTTGGLGYTLNRPTCKVTGTLQNVPLPLTGTVVVFAHTGIGMNSFNVSVNADNTDGTYTLWLGNGSWTIDPPNIPNRVAPSAPVLTIGNSPDTAQTANLLYSSLSGVHDQDGTLPRTFALLQNYPNPFNPTTQINYELPVASHVDLTVYDVLGRIVTVLVDESKSAGRYVANWDGTDSHGTSVASGIYFYRITAGTYTNAKKMILLK